MRLVDRQDDNGPTFAPFGQITEQVLAELNRQDLLREEALALSRKVIRASANAIRAVHRQQFEESQALMGSAGQALSRLGEDEASRLAEEVDHRGIRVACFLGIILIPPSFFHLWQWHPRWFPPG